MAYDATCPTCGAPTTVQSPFSKMAVCASCGSTLWLVEGGVKAGPKMTAPTPAISGLFVGAEGKLEGRPFRVVGRVRYKHARGFWDEWALASDDAPRWLSEDEGELSLETRTEFSETIPTFDEAKVGASVLLAGEALHVEEKDTAVCESGEGELPFVIEPGEKIPYLEGTADGKMATLEYDEDGPVLFFGKYIPLRELELTADAMAQVERSRTAAPRKAAKFDCPSCGGTLKLRTGGDADMIVCEYCDTRIDVSSDKYKPLGKVLRAGPKDERLKIGMKGDLRGVEWEIVGRLRYRDITPW